MQEAEPDKQGWDSKAKGSRLRQGKHFPGSREVVWTGDS